eukprot:6469022-Amphidinium_carterae.1
MTSYPKSLSSALLAKRPAKSSSMKRCSRAGAPQTFVLALGCSPTLEPHSSRMPSTLRICVRMASEGPTNHNARSSMYSLCEAPTLVSMHARGRVA